MSRRTGQIKKRGDGRYLVRIFLGRDPDTGKRKYQSRTVRGTKRDAERYRAKVAAQLDQGVLIGSGRVTVGEYLDRWLEEAVEPSVSPRRLSGRTSGAGQLRAPLHETNTAANTSGNRQRHPLW